jgi:hypothetical protein
MNSQLQQAITIVTLSIAALLPAACSREAPVTPVPPIVQVPAEPASAPASAPDTSVPAADSVIRPASEARPDSPAGRPNTSMTRAQESSQMPIPGQNNDHSAPVVPAKPASSR